MTTKERIGQQIRSYRLLRNMTQAQLAEAIGLTPSAIAMYETGQREPDQDTKEAIADVFNISIHDITPDNKESEPLSPERMELVALLRSAPESKIHLLLSVMKSILEGE